jgi:hypothetical protein
MGKPVQVFDCIFVNVELTMLSGFNVMGAFCEQSDSSGVRLEGVQDSVI